MVDVINQKNPILAGILSFLIVGAGQMYNGQIKKGILLLIAGLISGFLLFFLIGFILLPIVYIYAIYDAYTTADKINKGEIFIN
ncbi:TM2 domain-containing membrane protein YozV [Methanococcus voltae PS]|uniref:TM2 domain-containing membrane protein YozV n=1 Tax=Methanococcus voltae PS TaxID=523842 RepID=A0ABT2EX45_METVO|nr:DUF4870 domain-containing protein [Methanococcus voltae]MCS3922410.1 TM2 domain-containing membrane protein YozV [Methanococcus voltae PS]